MTALSATFPDVPGLQLAEMTSEHKRDAWRRLDTGAAWASDESRGHTELWGDHPHRWAAVLAFQGQPLEYRILRVDPRGHVAVHELTVRVSLERPSWFWSAIESAVLAALRAVGQASVWAQDTRRWPNRVVAWHREQLEALPAGFGLRWPTERSGVGWPARRSGPTGSYAGVTLREGTAEDLPAARALLDRTWSDDPAGRVLTGRLLEEWWHLDRAALLLLELDGTLHAARMVRHRLGTTAGHLWLTPALEDSSAEPLAWLRNRWMQGAGYTSATMFLTDRQAASPRFRRALDGEGWQAGARHTHFARPFTEVHLDVADLVARAPEAI
jgi:hypothetical protein